MMTIPEFDKINQEMVECEKKEGNVADDLTNSNEQKITFLYAEIDRLEKLVNVLLHNSTLQTNIAAQHTQLIEKLVDLYKPNK